MGSITGLIDDEEADAATGGDGSGATAAAAAPGLNMFKTSL